MKVTKATKRILVPLSEHRSQLSTSDGYQIGSFNSSDPETPTISHADFVEQHVLPKLEGACNNFGQQNVAAEIVQCALPLYQKERMYGSIPSDETAAFLSCTLSGGYEAGNISSNVENVELAAKYGIKYVFGPICDLGIVHQEEKVFSVSKFFHHHACRMGEVVDNFSYDDYLAYIEVCKMLLRNGLYDWSVEQSPENWGMLRPSIRLYGMQSVLEPMAKSMIDIGHLPGTKDLKYKFSLMISTIRGLFPLMIPKVRKKGVEEIEKMLQPITNFILELSEEGAFRANSCGYYGSEESKFFQMFGDNLKDIHKKGITQFLKEIRPVWVPKLIESSKKKD